MSEIERWVEEQIRLAEPDDVYWCDGSEEEARKLVEKGLKEEKIDGHPIFYELNQKSFPNAYLHRSHPSDVARTERLTFVCHPDRETAGPTNNWMDPDEAKRRLTELSKGCMKGRTMYVLTYSMGHPDSPYSRVCVQVTDSVYVAVSMRIMARLGKEAREKAEREGRFVKGFHSILDLNPERRFIMHFPQDELVWSVGSGYGGNALLGKKCFSLRIASYLGFYEGWFAEHMLLIGVETPDKEIFYIAAAMPSATGKTNLAMLQSTLPGYKVWTLGDDIAWLFVDEEGTLRAINPEMGFFGVAPGTSYKTNPVMMETLKAGKFYPTLFTNTAVHPETNEPWWEGIDDTYPRELIDWQGRKWEPYSREPAAHPNSRFTVSILQCPSLSPEFESPRGVPISAILFGMRRSTTYPVVFETFDWEDGVFHASIMTTEKTAAAEGKVGKLRVDPMAMRPFCGYNMADYFAHWLRMKTRMKNPPKIFMVNWFRRDENGKFLWPGFGENIRVLKWIIDRIKGRGGAKETPIGLIPTLKGSHSLERDGLNVRFKNLKRAFEVNPEEWRKEMEMAEEFYSMFGDRIPDELKRRFSEMKRKLSGK